MSQEISLLVAIPYWAGDSHRVTNLARVLSGLALEHQGNKAWVFLVNRLDCPVNQHAADILSKKFTTRIHPGTSTAIGYPMGSNGLFNSFFTTARFFYGRKNRAEAVLWLEPDALPCRRDWIELLLLAWRARGGNIRAMGHIFDIGGSPGTRHLNGGALYDPSFLDYVPECLDCHNLAWDWEKRAEILRVAADTPWIRYCHACRDATELDPSPPAIIHGYKDDSLAKLVMERYKISA